MKLGSQYLLPPSDPVSPERLFLLPCSGSVLHFGGFCFVWNRQGFSLVSSVSVFGLT